jgi:phosphoglycolate phosphatase
MTQLTHVFAGMQPVLAELQVHGMPWGIVTNKARRFTEPLVRSLGLDASAATVVCGDTTPHSKPHPAPLLEAARQLELDPRHCIYVGDDLRDVQAGQAAGMGTVAAAWGYLGLGEAIADWGADHVIQTPNELLKLLTMA